MGNFIYFCCVWRGRTVGETRNTSKTAPSCFWVLLCKIVFWAKQFLSEKLNTKCRTRKSGHKTRSRFFTKNRLQKAVAERALTLSEFRGGSVNKRIWENGIRECLCELFSCESMRWGGTRWPLGCGVWKDTSGCHSQNRWLEVTPVVILGRILVE